MDGWSFLRRGHMVLSMRLATAALALLLSSPYIGLSPPEQSQIPAGSLARPVFQPCPPNTTTYPNATYPRAPTRFGCQFVINDNGNSPIGNTIGVRLGQPGPLGSEAFGAIHYQTDHNLSDDAVATVIANNGAPRLRTDGRWVYGLSGILAGESIVTIEVVVVPENSDVDGYRFGVLTAYCLGTNVCPEGIDESLEVAFVD